MAQPTPLKLAVVTSGRSQREVADSLGLSEAYFSKIVNGRHVPAKDTKAAIAKALGRETGELWPIEAVAA